MDPAPRTYRNLEADVLCMEEAAGDRRPTAGPRFSTRPCGPRHAPRLSVPYWPLRFAFGAPTGHCGLAGACAARTRRTRGLRPDLFPCFFRRFKVAPKWPSRRRSRHSRPPRRYLHVHVGRERGGASLGASHTWTVGCALGPLARGVSHCGVYAVLADNYWNVNYPMGYPYDRDRSANRACGRVQNRSMGVDATAFAVTLHPRF